MGRILFVWWNSSVRHEAKASHAIPAVAGRIQIWEVTNHVAVLMTKRFKSRFSAPHVADLIVVGELAKSDIEWCGKMPGMRPKALSIVVNDIAGVEDIDRIDMMVTICG